MADLTALRGVPLTKGHATENDFVLLADPDGTLELDAATIAAVCDRRAGIGADGLVRAVRTASLTDPTVPEAQQAEWFMDYRNADGSRAEMCGNAIRLLVAYLVDEELLDTPEGEPVAIATRGGVRTVWRSGGEYTVDMGAWHLPGGDAAARRAFDVAVQAVGLEGTRAGLRVDLPNPHVVVALPDTDELDGADLGPRVAVDPPQETNVELVVPLGETTVDGERAGRVRMRVQERGVGETRSCGTGACAAAVALRTWGGPEAPRLWRVHVPGGELGVRLTDDGRALLTGPATLVARVALR